MHVPFLELRRGYDELKAELDAALSRVMSSGWYILGAETRAFEEEFAAYCGTKYGIGVGNGLDALVLILRALDVGPGDEVIVPSNTFIATWLAVSQVGATPVPVEPDPHTFNLDPASVAGALTSRTKVLMPVHLYGQTADMASIVELAKSHGIKVVEDAAQAHGARFEGRRAGGLADAAGFSFYPGKNLGAFGDGGMVTTDDSALAARVRLLRNYGSRVKYEHLEQGTNSRLDEIQAAVLRVKLAHLDRGNERRREVASRYLRELNGVGIGLPIVLNRAEPVWHLFVVRSSQRDAFVAALKARGVEVGIHYPAHPAAQRAYRSIDSPSLPIADALSKSVVSLPISPWIQDDEVTHVIASVIEAAREVGAKSP
ncbi:MAG: DegT/DnrJ/EryC1/StrS family aminotransferase [Myxococcales bacterium]|nr:DegT/DnrJ/EryC1/StrS family aminotransferase [Myxococcales bacterium]